MTRSQRFDLTFEDIDDALLTGQPTPLDFKREVGASNRLGLYDSTNI